MTSNPIVVNDERIDTVVDSVRGMITNALANLPQESNNTTTYTWNTTNGINTDVFDTGSTITLICQNNIRHIIGNLVTKAKDANDDDITFTAGTAISVLPSTSFSTSILRYTNGLPDAWLVELDGNGIRIASTALVTITGAHTISFSYTYIITDTETEVISTSS